MNPLITVYLVNHNYGQYIHKSIQSVLNQNFKDYELIIIDDGSTDNSREIIEQHRNDSRVKIIYQQNKGLNVTNNIAIKASSGDYVIRLDADDYLDENAILILYQNVQKNNYDMIFPDYYIIDEDDNLISTIRRHDFQNDVKLYDEPAHGACTLIRKKCLKEVCFYSNEFSCQDGYDIWLKLVNKYKIGNVNLPLFYYRQHAHSMSSNENKILKTRQSIKEKNVNIEEIKCEKHICIIPIRGTDKELFALRKIANKPLIDYTIECIEKSKLINSIILTSPDERICDYVSAKYTDIIVDKRPIDLSYVNTHIEPTIEYILKKYFNNVCISTISIAFIEFPLRTPLLIDELIETLYLFNVDSVESVRQESSIFYKHDGSGLISINGNNSLKLERNIIYRVTGGVRTVKFDYFNKKKSIVGDRVGHVIIDEKSSIVVNNSFGWEIAELLITNKEI